MQWLKQGFKKVEMPQAEVFYKPDFLSQDEADLAEKTLLNELNWQSFEIQVFGRFFRQPRQVAFYGDPGVSYTYSHTQMEALPWTPMLRNISEKLEHTLNIVSNSVLCNLYHNGHDGMGLHQDNEPELGRQPIIASLSLGEKRKFHFRHLNKEDKVDLYLKHGSLLIMSGPTQTFWKHGLPKTKKILNPRINLTFRQIDGFS